MSSVSRELLSQGLEAAFIDSACKSNLAYRPEFLYNDYKEGKKVISAILSELSSCEEFIFSVAFITESGITMLIQTLKELESKGIKGKILTTDYQTFTQPKALERLNALSNIELRMYLCDGNVEGFHTKGYIFKEQDIYRMIIGSSNLTQNALSQNKEWNTKIISSDNGQYACDVLSDFNNLWNSENAKVYDEFVDEYSKKYEIVKKQKELASKEQIIDLDAYKLEPNKMQIQFVDNFKDLVDNNENKALLISATATGKTYASAFGLRDIEAKKILFLVHRETIAKQARRSYQKVFGSSKTFGLLSGNEKDVEKDFLFSTMQMMAKDEIREQFDKNQFDAIVIDEAHRAGANSYQKIMSYFTPKIWLGMTASPERTDDFDIFNLFDHNIAYEIRLEQALEYDLLCPFHYFGISDLEINGQVIDDNTEFRYLTSDQRVKHIIDKINLYGYSGNRPKGLIFCSRKEEAVELSNKFNDLGYRTVVLTGENTQQYREECIDRLESDSRQDYLEYIFTIDIFNEGVDIPQINQVVMLRPTKSPIIFVQQLGRGLRKSDDKEYVVVLDFIGNYDNNYMIPIALSGDRSYRKDNIRRFVAEGTRVIPGASTVEFDEITKKRIYKSIEKENFRRIDLIRDSYNELKRKLGRQPTLFDFDEYGSIDPEKIFSNNSLKTYHMFLKKYDKDYKYYKDEKASLGEDKEIMLAYISTQFADGKRVHELLAIKLLIAGTKYLFNDLAIELCKYNIELNDNNRINLINILKNEFLPAAQTSTYKGCVLIKENGDDYTCSTFFGEMLKDRDFKELVLDTIDYAIFRFNRDYADSYKDSGFKLYETYTYHDVCRILNWHKDEVSLNIGGYKYNKDTNTYPVYINYVKGDDIQDTIRYEDEYIDNQTLKHISKSKRTLNSPDVKQFINADQCGTKVDLFMRKNKDDNETKEFYYMGRIHPSKNAKEIVMQDGITSAVSMIHNMEVPVREDLFDYFTMQEID